MVLKLTIYNFSITIVYNIIFCYGSYEHLFQIHSYKCCFKCTVLISDYHTHNMKLCLTRCDIYLILVSLHLSKSLEDTPIATSLNTQNGLLKSKYSKHKMNYVIKKNTK